MSRYISRHTHTKKENPKRTPKAKGKEPQNKYNTMAANEFEEHDHHPSVWFPVISYLNVLSQVGCFITKI